MDGIRDLVVVGDNTVGELLRSQEMLNALPVLRQHAQRLGKASDCLPCKQKRTQQVVNLNGVKQSLSSLDPAGLAILKTYLKTKTLRFIWKNNVGQVETRTV
jgi:hypothetical protein